MLEQQRGIGAHFIPFDQSLAYFALLTFYTVNMYDFYHRLDALANNVWSPLQHLTFEPGSNCWLLSPLEGLRKLVKDYLHLLMQLGLTENEKALIQIKLRSLIEKKFADKFRVVVYHKKRFVTVVGLSREDQMDCRLDVTIVRDKNCEEKNKKWIELKKLHIHCQDNYDGRKGTGVFERGGN
jgi:hypothetical protein